MPDKRKSVFISTPFCECSLRKLEAIKLKNYFSLNNFELATSYADADYHLCISCSVTKINVNYHLDYFKEVQKAPGELIVMGCLPGTNQEDLETVFTGKKIVTKNINEIDRYFPDFRIKFHQVPDVYFYDIGAFHMFTELNLNKSAWGLLLKYGLSKTFFRQYNRQHQIHEFLKANQKYNTTDPCFFKISSGCANNCAYCNIREAIGKIKSKSIDNLVEEYSGLLKQGYRNFHIVAEDICSYGLDIKSSLSELLKALSDTDKGYTVKWALNGVNPNWLVKNYKELSPLFNSKIWEIMIAVESGSDRIIELMNRHYKIKEVENALVALRKINTGLRINGLFIIGFPSETEEDFGATLSFLQKVNFDDVIFSDYSEFENRASAKIFPKVSEEIILERKSRAKKILQSLKTPNY